VTRARRQAPRRRRSRVPALLLRLALFTTGGFALGAVAGALVEAPRLLLGHVAGGTQSVVLAEPGHPVSSPPRLPAPAPLGTGPTPPAPARAPLPAVSAPSPRGGFAVQVGAFADPDGADRLRARLLAGGYPTYVERADSGRGPSWRVRVGPVPGEAEAQRLAARLKREERLPTWVQALGP
jgi:cell division septation protein DedD